MRIYYESNITPFQRIIKKGVNETLCQHCVDGSLRCVHLEDLKPFRNESR